MKRAHLAQSATSQHLTPTPVSSKIKQKKKLKTSLKRLREATATVETPTQEMDVPGLPSTASAPACALPSRAHLGLEYLDLAETSGVGIKCSIFHVRRMVKESLLKYQLMEEVWAPSAANLTPPLLS